MSQRTSPGTFCWRVDRADTMPDGLLKTAGVAVIPCFNEGRNPIDLSQALLAVPGLDAIFVDDASEGESREVLQSLAQFAPRVRVVRNAERAGKVSSLLGVMRSLQVQVERIVLLDCDVVVEPDVLQRVLDELQRVDLVLVNSVALPHPRTIWGRGALFSARRHERLRAAAIARYPALCSNGRLLGMSRRLVQAVLESDVPRHTEDAHFMLVCLDRGFSYSYLPDARIAYRAPDTLGDYLRQSNRFSEGCALLAQRWPQQTLARWCDPKPADLASTFAAQAIADPVGAVTFLVMLAVKAVQRAPARTQEGAWAVATSTKSVR